MSGDLVDVSGGAPKSSPNPNVAKIKGTCSDVIAADILQTQQISCVNLVCLLPLDVNKCY